MTDEKVKRWWLVKTEKMLRFTWWNVSRHGFCDTVYLSVGVQKVHWTPCRPCRSACNIQTREYKSQSSGSITTPNLRFLTILIQDLGIELRHRRLCILDTTWFWPSVHLLLAYSWKGTGIQPAYCASGSSSEACLKTLSRWILRSTSQSL